VKYDFDTVPDRRFSHSAKWAVKPGELPMSVADMDFLIAPPIVQAIQDRAAIASFGYAELPPAWAEAVAGWWNDRHQWAITEKSLAFCTGVIPALSSIVRSCTPLGGSVLVQKPVYNHFFSSIIDSGRQVVSNDLVYQDGHCSINWDDLEKKLAREDVALFFLCNPHNPTGQIWTVAELARIGALAAANDVIVVSDEIHCDVTSPGMLYTPWALAAPDCPAIICLSATKTFSIPGLQTSAVVVEDDQLRAKVFAGLSRDEIGEPNAFAIDATIAAFRHGADWVDQMRVYVQDNKDQATKTIEQLGLYVVPSQATYLIWVDGQSLVGQDGDLTDFCQFLRTETGLIINEGAIYGAKGFFRMNLGCPRSLVEDGLDRLARGLTTWQP